jgi:serine/threonine-protein kinase
VAIKRMHPEFANNPTLLQRFQQEAKLAGSICNDYICEVNDYGMAADGSPYLVMPLLRGRSLSDILKISTRLDLLRGVCIVNQILQALEAVHAHPKKIVHRDLKPDNVFLTSFGDKKDVVKLLDFGIAKVRKASATTVHTRPGTEPGSVLGTPSYMAPEQAKGDDDIDHRADIYAVGAILYECLTGIPPYRGKSYQSICIKVIVDPCPMPRSLEPSITEEVEKVILKAMAKDRAQRFQSAKEMRDALEFAVAVKKPGAGADLAEGTTVLHNKPSLAEGSTEPGRDFEEPPLRRPKWIYAILAFLCLGVIGVSFALAYYRQSGLETGSNTSRGSVSAKEAKPPSVPPAPKAAALPDKKVEEPDASTVQANPLANRETAKPLTPGIATDSIPAPSKALSHRKRKSAAPAMEESPQSAKSDTKISETAQEKEKKVEVITKRKGTVFYDDYEN